MYQIECIKLFKKENKARVAYVSNHPTNGENASFTTDKRSAHTFTDMAACKNIRDDVLQVVDRVSILKV